MERRKPTTTTNCILVNDPSITAWGWVVVSSTGEVIEAGAIKTEPTSKKLRTRKGDDRVRRVSEINGVLLGLIGKYNPVLIISELPHGSQSAGAAVMIGIVTGIMQTIGDCNEIPVEWYSEGDAKKALSGKRSLTKEETIQQIHEKYSVPWKKTKWENEAIADAMAVYHVASQQSQILKMIKR